MRGHDSDIMGAEKEGNGGPHMDEEEKLWCPQAPYGDLNGFELDPLRV